MIVVIGESISLNHLILMLIRRTGTSSNGVHVISYAMFLRKQKQNIFFLGA